MRFLIDAQLPPALADWLKTKGHEAEHVSERLGAERSDTFIAGVAATVGSILVSKDADFLDLLVNGKPQFLWVRIGNSTNRLLTERFEAEWARVEDALSRGEAVVDIA